VAKLIAFEGIDGTGKSSAVAHVVAALHRGGLRVEATREETDTWRGEAVRRSIAEGLDPLATTFLFLADRVTHVHEMQAWLQSGRHVLTDRYMHSTLAYQSVTLEGRIEEPMAFLRHLHAGWCPMPDRVVLFVADPETCVARAVARGARVSRYEKAAFLESVQARYLGLAEEEPQRFVVVDADRGMAEVHADALAAVQQALAA
jgi:dTMP kinase